MPEKSKARFYHPVLRRNMLWKISLRLPSAIRPARLATKGATLLSKLALTHPMQVQSMTALPDLLTEIRRCQICAEHLPLGARPVLQLGESARILIAGQAPGRKVHASGVPFDDASGDRLRDWLGVSPDTFYDPTRIAILPMGFCYPGTGRSGDLPPRPECAATWLKPVLANLQHIELTLIIGQYAMAYHLPGKGPLTEAVRNWQESWPTILPLPHPSPRNNIWLKRNPWFAQEVLPALRRRVAELLA